MTRLRLRIGLSGALIVLLAGCDGSPAPSPASAQLTVAPTATVAAIPKPTVPATPFTPSASSASAPAEPTGDLLFFRGSGVEGAQIGSAWIVFVASSQPVQLGPAIDASWAADGRSIHVVSQDDECVPTLTTVSVEGPDVRYVSATVRSGLRSLDGAFAWSQDGRQVLFSRYHNGPPDRMCGSQGGVWGSDAEVQDIMVMKVDGTDQRVLVPLVWPQRPIVWSPDGTRIAFANAVGDLGQNRLDPVVVRLSDGVLTHLTKAPFEGVTSPRWSPDGTRLAFTFFVDGLKHLGVITVEGAELRDLGTIDSNANQPAWSPDGGAIAVAFFNDASPGDILILQADGTGRLELSLTDVGAYSGPPAWSPDGAWLAYIRTADKGQGLGGISLVSADGSARRELAETSGAQLVAWQPAP